MNTNVLRCVASTVLRATAIATLVLATSGCSGEETATPTRSLSADDPAFVHSQVEDTIELCMREQGFNYQRRVFVSPPTLSEERPLFRPATDWRAYGAAVNVVRGTRETLLQEALDDSDQTSPEHLVALFGTRHDGNHDHEIDTDTDTPEIDGCLGLGLNRQRELERDLDRSSDDLDAARAYTSLSQLPVFAEFERAWIACMKSAGIQSVPSTRLELLVEMITNEEFSERLSALVGEDESFRSRLEALSVIDQASFGDLISRDNLLAEAFEAERELYVQDSDCVAEAYPIIDPAVQDLLVSG